MANLKRFQKIENGLFNFVKEDGTFLCKNWLYVIKNFNKKFKDGFSPVQILKNKWNFIKPDGTFLSKIWFKNVNSFNEGFAAVQNFKDECNFIKSDGSFLSSDNFYHVHYFSESGVALIQKYCFKSYNYLRVDGSLLSPNEDFIEAGFFNNVGQVTRENKLFEQYIDYNGNFYYKCTDGTYTKDPLIYSKDLKANFPKLYYLLTGNTRLIC